MYRSTAILLMFGIARFALAEAPEPAPPPASAPLKMETPGGVPAVRANLPSGALFAIGSARVPHTMSHGQFAFSPDGKLVAAGTQRGGYLSVWDEATGKVVRHFGPFEKWFQKVVFAPDGQSLAVAFAIPYALDAGSVHLFELATGTEIGQLEGSADRVVDIAFSADGKKIATAASNKKAAIWDRATRKQLRSLDLSEWASMVAFSPDSETLAVANNRGVVSIFKASTGTMLRRLDGLKSGTSFLKFADDGKTLLACGEEEGLIAWDVATGVSKRRLAQMNGSAVISPDSSQLAVLSGYGSIEPVVVWDVKSGKQIVTIKGNHGAVSAGFAPDNRSLATYDHDQILRFWKLPGGEEINPPAGHQGQITGVGFVRDGNELISASEDGTVRFWDAATGKELKRFSTANERFYALALSPDAKTLVLAGGVSPLNWRSNRQLEKSTTLRFINTETGKEVRTFHYTGEMIAALRFTADSRQLFAVGTSVARLIDAANGKWRELGVRDDVGLLDADITLDGRFLAQTKNMLSSWEIAQFETQDNKQLVNRGFDHSGLKNPLAFTPDGRLLAVAGSPRPDTSSLQLWDRQTDKIVRSFDTNGEWFGSLVFSRDGRLLAAAAGDRIDVFEVATGKRRHEFAGHEGGIGALAISRDGQRLVSGGIDGRVMVWDLTGIAGTQLSKIEEKELDKLWSDLASEDAAIANKAIAMMSARPAESAPFLRRRLPVVSDADLKRIDALIAELDDGQFRVRQRAAGDLAKLGESARLALKRALASSSAEVRQAAEQLLEKIDKDEDPVDSPEARRAVRAIEALERIGNEDAIALLTLLRQRGNRLIVHREAKRALARVEKR